MEKQQRNLIRLLTNLMLVFLIGVTVFAFPLSASAGNAVVIACSDYQYMNYDDPAYNVGAAGNEGGAILAGMVAKQLGVTGVNGLLCAGDYDVDLNRNADDTADGIRSLKGALNASGLTNGNTQWVLVQGNHDPRSTAGGTSKTGKNDPSSGAYGVYVLNERDYPWYGGKEEDVKATAAALDTYLNDKVNKKFTAPIFVITHLPLHYTMRTWVEGDARYAKYIYNVLNNYSAHGLNIIYLFGHDHSQGWDDYLGGSKVFLRPGDRINISDGTREGYTTRTLKFVYMNAGYMGYYRNHNSATGILNPAEYHIEDLTMSRFMITNSSVAISRYNTGGQTELKKAGVPNWYRDENTLQNYSPNTNVVGTYTMKLSSTVGHSYGSWTVVKEPTYTATGLEMRVCAYDSSHVETRSIAKLKEAAADDKGDSNNTQEAKFGPLQAKAVKVSTTTVKVQWKKVKGATGYVVYGTRCGQKQLKKLATVSGTSYTQKKLKKGTYYKYVVTAVSSGRTISTSKLIHVVTKGGKYGNPVKLTVSKSKVTLKKGRTYIVTTSVKNDKKGKKHRAVAFESGNTKIATVTGKGTIKGVGKGTCSIYVYAQNGLMKKIQVTVK